jgi:hypothetical protein
MSEMTMVVHLVDVTVVLLAVSLGGPTAYQRGLRKVAWKAAQLAVTSGMQMVASSDVQWAGKWEKQWAEPMAGRMARTSAGPMAGWWA